MIIATMFYIFAIIVLYKIAPFYQTYIVVVGVVVCIEAADIKYDGSD